MYLIDKSRFSCDKDQIEEKKQFLPKQHRKLEKYNSFQRPKKLLLSHDESKSCDLILDIPEFVQHPVEMGCCRFKLVASMAPWGQQSLVFHQDLWGDG